MALKKATSVYKKTGGAIIVCVILAISILLSLFGYGSSARKVDVVYVGSQKTQAIVETKATNCDADDTIDSVEQQMVNKINAFRSQKGLSTLLVSSNLQRAATWFVQDMGAHQVADPANGRWKNDTSDGKGAHTDSLGRYIFTRVSECGYPGASTENANFTARADSATNVDYAFDAWVNSAGHNATMSRSDLRMVGVARHTVPIPVYGSLTYWVADFGTSDDGTRAGDGGSGGSGGTGGGGTAGGVCGKPCSGTCPHGGIVKDGPGGTDIDHDFTGQCGQAYYGTDDKWYACTGDRGWVPVAPGSCLNGSIINHETGACITNEFIGSPTVGETGNKVCGSDTKEYQCSAGVWNPTGQACGPGTGGGGTGGGGVGGGSGSYSITVTLDKPSYKPGDTMKLCYKLSRENVAFHVVVNYSPDGGAYIKVREMDDNGAGGGDCIFFDLESDAKAGTKKFQIQAFISNQKVAEGEASATVTATAPSPTPTTKPVAPSPTPASPTVTSIPPTGGAPTPTGGTAPTPTTAPGTTPGQPTPTTPAGGTTVALSIKLEGVGANASQGENNAPNPSSRVTGLDIFAANGEKVLTSSANLAYDSTSSSFKGSAPVTIPAGFYIIKVRMSNTLWKAIASQQITSGGTTNVPATTLVSGDINEDNVLNLSDYNILLSCYGSKPCSQKTQADLNSDGKVDEKDLNIFYDGLSNRQGD